MGIFGNDHTIHIQTPDAAQYGNTPNGFADARDEAWKRVGENDADQSGLQRGMTYANGQATSAGPIAQAQQDTLAAGNQASGANGNQRGAIDLARQMATGSAPSAAAYQLQRGLNQASSGQQAMYAGARGSAALATGGANMAANTANLQQNAYSAAGQLRANEMAQGRGLLGSLSDAQRAQDASALGEANAFGMANANRSDRTKLGFGDAAATMGGVANGSNAVDLNRYNQGMAPVYAQNEADQQHQNWQIDARRQADAANAENK